MNCSTLRPALVAAACLLAYSPARAQWLEPATDTTLEVAGTVIGDAWAFTVESVGDVTGDQFPDVAMVASLSDQGSSNGGLVRVVSGADGSTVWTRLGTASGGIFGYALEVADWNGDGVLDVFASAPFDNGGSVFVHSGDDGTLLHTFGPGNLGDGFGASIALGHDFDGDGSADVAIASPWYDLPGFPNVGRVSVFSGVGGSLITTIDGPQTPGIEAEFGVGLAFVGDVSVPADGRAELVIGHRLAVFFDGRAQVHGWDGASASLRYTVSGVGMGFGLFGDRIDGGRDLDGDGRGDFFVGDVVDSVAKVFSGVDGALLYTLDGESMGAPTGFGTGHLVPDVDGDGCAELLIGARDDGTGADSAGRVLLYSGKTGALLRTMTHTGAVHRLGLTSRSLEAPAGAGGLWFLLSGNGGGTQNPPPGRFVILRTAPWFPTFCESTANSTGHPATIVATGSASIAANDLSLHAAPLPEGQPGLFFFGPAAIQLPFGNGFRCVGSGGANAFRLPATNVLGGELSHALENTAAPAAGELLPGTTWHFQAWFRDPDAGGAGFDLSNGLSVEFGA